MENHPAFFGDQHTTAELVLVAQHGKKAIQLSLLRCLPGGAAISGKKEQAQEMDSGHHVFLSVKRRAAKKLMYEFFRNKHTNLFVDSKSAEK